jgi:O-antigen/teichoic acid export membrane protein
MIKLRNPIIKNTLITIMPSIVSILFSLASVPIFLNFGDLQTYGEYIFAHIIISFGFFLTFGFAKITALEIIKKKELAKSYFVFSILKTIIIFIITLILFKIFRYYKFSIFSESFDILIICGICLTTLFCYLESILQGLKLFKSNAISNFFFYGFSITSSSLIYFFNEEVTVNNLFIFSLTIKVLSISAVILMLIKNKILNKGGFSLINIFANYKSAGWITLSLILVQIYDFLDKYLIKIAIGSKILGSFSIAQQISGKMSIISKGLSFTLLPNVSKKKNGIKITTKAIEFILYIFSLFLVVIVFPSLKIILSLWLGKSFSELILNLSIVFFFISWVSCISHIYITFYEGNKIFKKNSLIEITFLPLFLTMLIVSYIKKDIMYFCMSLLIKEIIFLISRSWMIKNKIIIFNEIVFNIICMLCLTTLIYFKYNYLYVLLSVIYTYYLIKKIKLENLKIA